MAKILKNTTGSDIELEIGITIPASSNVTVEILDYIELAESSDINTFITSGDIVVNDGVNDLSVTDGINYVNYPDQAENIRVNSLSLVSTNVKDALEELSNTPGEEYALFPIWAEENAGLGNNQREWSFGNGATGDIGIVLPINADLFAVSYNADTAGTNTEIAVVQNTSSQVATTGPQSGEDGFVILGSPVAFSAGDRLGFQTIIAGGAVDVRVCAWFRVPITTLLDVGLNDLNDVILTSPSSGEVLVYNGTDWVNQELDADDIDDSTTVNKFATQVELDQIATNTSNISINTGNIATNTANITTNTSDIATNASNIAQNTSDISDNTTAISDHINDPTDAHDASAISYDNSTSGLVATEVQSALDEVDGDLDSHIADLNNPHQTTFTQAVSADPGTDITTAEAEELTDGSTTQLHFHRELVDETGTNRVEVLDGGDIQLSNYPQTRNDVTSNDEKVLTTDNSGNVVLRRVLPFYASIKKISNAVDQVGVNQTTTLENWLVLSVNIPETGNYDIDWTYVWSLNGSANDFIAEILLDGNPISTYSQHVQEPKDSAGVGVNLLNTTGGITNTATNQRHRTTGFEPEVNLTTGNHTIAIQWAGSQANYEAAIYEGAIRIKRVS